MNADLLDYRAPDDLLSDRVILVTGAAAGIGSEAAACFAAHGATVALLDKEEGPLEQVYDRIAAAGHPQPLLIPLDLGQAGPAQFDQLATLLEQETGRLDGLLHNAAWLGALSPIEHFDPETWVRVFQVNVQAAFLLTRSCLGLLKQAPDASILFTSDQTGRRGQAYWGAYGASKFAVEGLMQTLADELENDPDIRVNSLDPGPVRTAMRRLAYPGEDPDRTPTADRLMPAYLYLMGPASRMTNGQALSAQRPDR